MSGDKYLEWLRQRKKDIEEKVKDDFFKKILLEINNDYTEEYVILTENRFSKEEITEAISKSYERNQFNDKYFWSNLDKRIDSNENNK